MNNRKPKGYWDDKEHLLSALRPLVEERGRMPSEDELRKLRLTCLSHAIGKHGGVYLIAKELGVAHEGRERGYWEEWSHVEKAVAGLVEKLGRFPMLTDIRSAGLTGMLYTVQHTFGGLTGVRERMGYTFEVKPPGYWLKWKHVETLLQKLTADFGRMPTSKELSQRGYRGLDAAIKQHYGGRQAVAARLNTATIRKPHGYWKEWEHVRTALAELTKRLGHDPSTSEIHEHLPGLITSLRAYHGGLRGAREKMGLSAQQRVNGYWDDFENVRKETEAVVELLGRFPSQRDLKAVGREAVSRGIGFHGGFPVVRERLGYVAVTDDHIAGHADILAYILPQLVTDPHQVWSAMKSRWTHRDLDAAIAKYNTDGSLARFRALVDQV